MVNVNFKCYNIGKVIKIQLRSIAGVEHMHSSVVCGCKSAGVRLVGAVLGASIMYMHIVGGRILHAHA